MKKIFKSSALLLYLLAIILFFFLGASYAGIADAGKGQGLAGGAIVFWYGLNFSFFAFVASLIIAYKASQKFIVHLNKILALLLLFVLVIIMYLFISKKKAEADPVINFVGVEHSNLKNDVIADSTIGLGFFTPNFLHASVFYFYGNPNATKTVSDHSPIDSIVFNRSEQGDIQISYAPPWLQPEHLKLDYDILLFKIESLTKEFAEVIVNRSTAKTAYVSIESGKVKLWAEFLLDAHSVEFLSEIEQPVFVKPLDYASEVNIKYEIMQPQLIKDSWMQVELLDNDYKDLGKGWIRWRKGEKLLIKYNLLS